MNIILNEYEWAQNAIDNRSLGGNPYDTVSLVAKYYAKNGHNKQEIRQYVEHFILSCEPEISMYKWDRALDKIVKSALKHPPVQIDSVRITKPEMDKIKTLSGVQLRRIAFVLLCVAKYMDIAFENNNQWVNIPDKDIMRMANINTSIKRQCMMYGELRDKGFIRFSKKINNLNVQVVFMEDGETAVEISDFRNLGYQYMSLVDDGYYKCANCGITAKMKESGRGRPPKYCPSCAVEVHTKRMVESTMRRQRKFLN